MLNMTATTDRPRYVYAKASGALFFKHPKSGKLPMPTLDAADFWPTYHKLMASVANNALPPVVKVHERHLGFNGPASVGGLAKGYFASEKFERLARRTAHMKRLYIERCLQTMHPEPMIDGKPGAFSMWHLDDVDKDMARDLRSALKYERAPNGRPLKKGGDLDSWRDVHMWAMRSMFAWAVDKPYKWRDERDVMRRQNANPFERLGDLCQDEGGNRPWQLNDYDRMMAFLTGERLWIDRLALALMRYTLVRRSDVVRIGAPNVQNIAKRGANRPELGIVFKEWKGSRSKTDRRQNKTRQIPILPELQTVLDETPGAMDRPTFLVGREGPFTDNHYGKRFNALCRDAGLPKGSTCHGIRHFAASTMAINGASAHVIQAWGGWADLRNVIRYTKHADQLAMMQAGAEFVA
jgi:integrase